MSSQCTIFASSSVSLLELRKGINSRSVNVFLSSTLLSASLIKPADEIWIQSDGLWLQLVQQQLNFRFLTLFRVFVWIDFKCVKVRLACTRYNYGGETSVVRNAKNVVKG